jgi:hypothetical protein
MSETLLVLGTVVHDTWWCIPLERVGQVEEQPYDVAIGELLDGRELRLCHCVLERWPNHWPEPVAF